MSQYGAYGQALEGATASEIVQYYYAGVSIETVADLSIDGDIDPGHTLMTDPTPVWVGIRQSITTFEIEPTSGPMNICQTTDDVETCVDVGWIDDAPDAIVVQTDDVGCAVTRRDADEQEAPPLDPGACDLTISYGAAGQTERVTLDQDACPDTGTAGRECFGRGTLQVRSDNVVEGFHVALEIGVEDYLYGLGEMPSSWPAEALAAQALAGRSYLIRRVLTHEDPNLVVDGDAGLTSSRQAECWCHVYSTSYDQNYVGHAKESDPTYSPAWNAAVDATADQVITHPSAGTGTVILAFYHSSSGGSTETNETVWGTSPLPYLVPVDDWWSNDEAVSNPYSSWEITATAGELAEEIGWDEVTHVSITRPAPGGEFELRGVLDGEVVSETKSSGWMYYAIGSRAPHFETVSVERFQPFLDMEGTGHYDGIYAVWEAGIAYGCGDDYYCPDELVTRAQMATFIARAVGLEPIEEGSFTDIETAGLHAGYINAVAEAGISLGCGEGMFCPDDLVNRAQMASFLARAAGLDPVSEGPFTDLDGAGSHVAAINAVAQAGISVGCGDGLYCPREFVNRAQMASFLARAFIWVEVSETSSTRYEAEAPT